MSLTDLDLDRLRGLEAVLFLADHPLDMPTIARALDCEPTDVEPLLTELDQRLVERQSGLALRHVGGGYRLYTALEARDHVERHVLAGRTGRLSQAALETLAVIAYKQPISRTEIGDIRGVNADGAVRSLVQRGLIEEVGRDDGPGQAVLYGTTTEFLERMGLASIDVLPPLADFLPEHPAPDEPSPDQLREARRRLQSGRDLPSTGASRWDPDADGEIVEGEGDGSVTDPEADERAAQAARRLQEVTRRREQEEEMDQLTGAMEDAALSAVSRLREALAAVESEEAEEDEGAEGDAEVADGDADIAPSDSSAETSSDAPSDTPSDAGSGTPSDTPPDQEHADG